jgi:hypothetical protein
MRIPANPIIPQDHPKGGGAIKILISGKIGQKWWTSRKELSWLLNLASR